MYERTYDRVLRIIINTIRIYGEGSKFTMATFLSVAACPVIALAHLDQV